MSDINYLIERIITDEHDDSYRGSHRAPDKETDAPFYDLTINGIYPKDVYTNMREYLHSESNSFNISVISSLLMAYRGKPNKPIVIYRAIIYKKNLDLIYVKYDIYQKAQKQFLKRNEFPSYIFDYLPYGFFKKSKSEIYDYMYDYINDHQSSIQDGSAEKEYKDDLTKKKSMFRINPGDWVSPSLGYVKDHGEAAKNQVEAVKIVKKTVLAKDIFTSGDGLLEWGYDPS
jgi:hypothetical protein